MNYLLINATKTQAFAIGTSFFKYEFHINDAKVETQATHNILGVVVGSELTFTLTYGEQLTKHGQSFRVAETTQVHFQGRNGRSLQDVCSPLGIL